MDKVVNGDDLGIQVAYLISTYETEYQDDLSEIFESTGTQWIQHLNGTFENFTFSMSICNESHAIFNEMKSMIEGRKTQGLAVIAYCIDDPSSLLF